MERCGWLERTARRSSSGWMTLQAPPLTFPPAGGLAQRALCILLRHLAVHIVRAGPAALGIEGGDAQRAAGVGNDVDGAPAKLDCRFPHNPGESGCPQELVQLLMLGQCPVSSEVCTRRQVGGEGEGSSRLGSDGGGGGGAAKRRRGGVKAGGTPALHPLAASAITNSLHPGATHPLGP